MSSMRKNCNHKSSACPVCGNRSFAPLFTKTNRTDYTLFRCTECAHRMLLPLPTADPSLYEDNYFMKRTDRGYNNYFSPGVRNEIERVLELNLKETGFFDFEKLLSDKRCSLDIGCAAGYCVSYLKRRGWAAKGIDISESCTASAVREGLDVICGEYTAADFREKFDLITLWATIEHLPFPAEIMKKISEDLKPGGVLLLSTCRAESPFARLHGRNWRFYNFPEHIHFFSHKGLKSLARKSGLIPGKITTYGSGFGRPGSLLRKKADRIAKSGLGDMLLFKAQKEL